MRRVFICAATNLLRWTTCNIITYTSGVISFETKSSYSSRMGPRFNLPTRFSSTSGVKPRLKQTCLIDDFPLDQSICRTLLAGERFQWQTRMRINPRQYVHNPTSSITFVEPSVGENNTFALTFTAHRRKRDKYWLEPIGKAITKFKAKPTTYCLIPCIAAIVGWVTNWLAVQMIFYPIQYRGFSLIRKDEVPLGLLGWQGIVPCKTRTMSETMVNMVTTQLLSVPKLFKRLNPRRMADLLAPEVPKIVHEVMADIAPSWIASVPKDMYCGLTQRNRELLQHLNHKFLIGFAKDIQGNVVKVFSVRNCVVDQMLQDRTMLGKLFQKCGSKELQFLTDSGLWFGFLLGILQMLVALFWENPWSLSIGGLIVGFATNWLALKWIFEPVNPTKIGPFVLQGQFLRRQNEVAKEFSTFFANNILTSERVWHSMLTDPETSPAFNALFKRHISKFVHTVTKGLRIQPEPEVIEMAASKALEKLPQHVGVLHPYIDKTLGLRDSLRTKMAAMSSLQFERVLHPVFEEDELTLILAGAALGFAAGLFQQGLETGAIKLPSFRKVMSKVKSLPGKAKETGTRFHLLIEKIKTLDRGFWRR